MSDFIYPHAASTGPATARRAHALYTNPADPKHGTNTGYSYGCRCENCKLASSQYQTARRALRANGWRA